MCAKCECKKESKWVSTGSGYEFVSPEGEYVACVLKWNDTLYKWGERSFISLEAAKAAVEKSFNPTLSDADMIKRIKDVIKKAAEPSRFGPPSSSALFMTIRRIVETPQK